MTKKTYGLQIKGLHLGVYETEEELVRMLYNLPDELANVIKRYGLTQLMSLPLGTTQRIAPGYRVQKVRTDTGDATC